VRLADGKIIKTLG